MYKFSIFSLVLVSTVVFHISPSSFADCKKLQNNTLFKTAPAPVMEKLMRDAGKKILALRNAGDFETQKKKDFSDLKTKGDCTSQTTIFSGLRAKFPKSNFLGEEKCEQKGSESVQNVSSEGVSWILDPIDGTTNYAHGMPHFSISLALVIDGEVCASGVYAPVYDEYFFAEKGKGAFLSVAAKKAKAIHVSQITQLNSSLFITGFEGGPSEKAKKKNEATTKAILEIITQSHDIRRTGSAALDLASIASGRAEGYWEYGEGLNWWDVSAGILLVTEAGGTVFVTEPKGNLNQNAVALERPITSIIATNNSAAIEQELKKTVLKHAP